MEVGSNENSEGKIDNSSKKVGSEDVRLGAAITENSKIQPDPSAAFGKAEGYGATAGVSSILTPASDSTDFEVNLSKVQEYEALEKNRVAGQSKSLENRVVFMKTNASDTQNAKGNPAPTSADAFEAVNMEASVTSDEMLRAGGFGATDNISSFLPVACDFTDFEAHLHDARDYEDCGKEVDRPGLGWSRETR